MKHLFRNLLIIAFVVCCNFQQALAQQMPPIPIDSNVRIGKLDNGLTYYIRKNNLPTERADFYIAQKVGSIQEEENQRGLAHFLEHMCFNGTTHFPGDALKQYLERIGVKFGENLNAYTSVDETVYNISNVPVNTPGAIDSCLLILHDWSNDLTLDPKEIDKERGVINEEWRTRMSAVQRFQEKLLPAMFAGTKYATCFPIGTMDVVMNFKPQTLRDYYEKWYRPDLQGIVVVGDVDVDAIEAQIKKLFADVPAQPDAAKREYYPVNDNKEPIVLIARDKEQPHIQAIIFNKHEATPDSEKGNMDYLIQDYAIDLINNMLNARLNELLQAANPPYIYAGTYDGEKPNKPLPASLYAKKMQWKTVSPPWSAKWNVPASLASLKANTNVPVPNICAIWNLTTTNVIHVGTRNILMNMYATSSTTNPYRVLKTNMPSSTR